MNKNKAISLIDKRFLLGVAHRGLHDDKATENGMLAFKQAIDNDVAFEYDVHLTKDNQLIVCHDENLVRTTGKEGIIEDLTLKEIKDNYRLLDGGEVPTLEEVFALNNEQVPMVIELKVFRKNYKPLAKYFLDFLNSHVKDKSKYLIISFDPRSLWPLKGKGYVRSLLVAKSDEYTWFFRNTVESVDLDKKLFAEKRVRKYAKNHFTNIWTIESLEEAKEYLEYVDTFTYQYIAPQEISDLLKSK